MSISPSSVLSIAGFSSCRSFWIASIRKRMAVRPKPMGIEIYRIHMGISIAALTRLFVMTMSVRDQPYHAQNTQKPQASSDENA